ncbi:MAG: SRPBCC domain-containing protein [Gammaproteobacteria bacterium]
MTSRILVSLHVGASPERAFEVFVRDIGAWWQPNELFCFTPRSPGRLTFEPELGGRFMETFPDGEVFEIGRITDWEPSTRLAFTWRQASFASDQDTRVEVRFEAVGTETRVTVTHSGWDTVPQDHLARHHFPDAIFLHRHAEWWQVLLAELAQRSAK